MIILFWFSLAFLFYAYAGYPLLITALAKIARLSRPAGKRTGHRRPAVTLLISAYNEEKFIEEKIRNSLALRYPRELLDIVVLSDGSSDRTNEIVRRYEQRGVRLKYFEGRIGKTACLNKGVPASRGEITVFSDANSLYDCDAVRHLVAPFADPEIGFVTGYTRYADKAGDNTSASLGLYGALEKITKKAESTVGSCVGADGAIFAIRTNLYQPLRNTDINDFVLPLRIVGQGYRGVLEERAFCIEKTAGTARGEFKRQIRITNRTLRALFRYRALFNPYAYGLFSFALFSHKAAKFIAPFFAILLAASATMLFSQGPAYGLTLGALAGAGLLALAEPVVGKVPILGRISSLCSTLVATNIAILGGWFQFLKGETYTTWSPVQR